MALRKTKILSFPMRFFALFLLCVSLPLTSQASNESLTSFSQAREVAKQKKQPLIVYFYGENWQPFSVTYRDKVFLKIQHHINPRLPFIPLLLSNNQNLDAKSQNRQKAQLKGTHLNAITTYPAIQVYDSNGLYIATLQGRELLNLTTPKALAKGINSILGTLHTRNILLAKIQESSSPREKNKALKALASLVLPANKLTHKLLKENDPKDHIGWQAIQEFKNWDFVRQVADLIRKNKLDDAHQKVNAMLSSKLKAPQQALVLGAKGMILAKERKFKQAWLYFKKAHSLDPQGANGKAMLRYGVRVSAAPLRLFDPLSPLSHPPRNLSKTATYTTSSTAFDDKKQRNRLFSGEYPSDFAFHTAREAGASILITLKRKSRLTDMDIINRDDWRLYDRATGLTIWIKQTKDHTWKQVWQAKEVKERWHIHFDTPISAQFIKIGIPQTRIDFFHLRAINIFGY